MDKKMQTPEADSRRSGLLPIIPLCLIVAVSVLAYANTFKSPFTFDDFHNFVENPATKIRSLDIDNLLRSAGNEVSPCRWLPNISFALNYYFSGHAVWSYHLVNLLVHILAGFAMYLLFAATLNLPLFAGRWQRAGEIALAAALLWAAHPLQTNAVTYIVQRMTSMAALFYLCSLLFYVKARLQNSNRKRYALYAASLLAWLMALASKENAVMLPLLILTYEFFFLRDPEKPINYRKLTAITAAVVVTVTIIGLLYLNGDPLQSIFSGYSEKNFTMSERLLTEARVVFHYLSLIALPLPSRLNLSHDFPLSTSLFTPLQTLPAVSGIVGLLILIALLYKRDRLAAFAILWFLANLAIESTVIPLEIIFEHRLYLPSAFIFLAAASLLYRLCPKNITCARGAVVIVIALLTFMTWQRNIVWATEISLWSDVVKKSPKLDNAYSILAEALNRESTGREREIESLYLQALKLNPDNGTACLNLGLEYLEQNQQQKAHVLLTRALNGRTGELLDVHLAKVHNALSMLYIRRENYPAALAEAELASKYYPEFVTALFNQGVAHTEMDNFAAAETLFLKAVKLNPEHVDAYHNLGVLFRKQNRLQEAAAMLEKALAVAKSPQPRTHHVLGKTYLQLNNRQGAIDQNLKAISLDPNLVFAYITLGITYEDMGLPQEAFARFKEAWQHGYDMVGLYNNWALSLLKEGKADRAAAYLRQALELAPGHAESHRNLGLVYERQGLPTAAQQEKDLAAQLQVNK